MILPLWALQFLAGGLGGLVRGILGIYKNYNQFPPACETNGVKMINTHLRYDEYILLIRKLLNLTPSI